VLIDLVGHLRCPQLHAETWLVASAKRTEGRHIIEGMLGCPICRAEYPIRDGVVWFGEEPGVVTSASDLPETPDLALRLAALLDLSDPTGFALLAGLWAKYARELCTLVQVQLIVLNPTPPLASGVGVSVLQSSKTGIPLAAAACRGVALDRAHGSPVLLESAVRILRPRGRLVAPASFSTPVGVTELVRDERLWLAERDVGPPKLVALGRGSGL
jgi:uncharacterized protein YbaR (Trm112 family)